MRLDRFWKRVRKTDSCWLWTGSKKIGGYGSVAIVTPDGRRTTTPAHRFSYLVNVGPIPVGYQIDHLCRVRLCVNPAHLEAVTPIENVRRASRLITHCKEGHPLVIRDPKRMHRFCKVCRLEQQRQRREPLKGTGPGTGVVNREKTHCLNGHPFDDENTYVNKRGSRMCRECMRARGRARRAARKVAA